MFDGVLSGNGVAGGKTGVADVWWGLRIHAQQRPKNILTSIGAK